MHPRAVKGGLGSEVRGALAAEPAFDSGTGACVGTEQRLSCKCEYVWYLLLERGSTTPASLQF